MLGGFSTVHPIASSVISRRPRSQHPTESRPSRSWRTARLSACAARPGIGRPRQVDGPAAGSSRLPHRAPEPQPLPPTTQGSKRTQTQDSIRDVQEVEQGDARAVSEQLARGHVLGDQQQSVASGLHESQLRPVRHGRTQIVVDDRARRIQAAPPTHVSPPGDIDILQAKQETLVEAAELVEHRPPVECRGATRGKDLNRLLLAVGQRMADQAVCRLAADGRPRHLPSRSPPDGSEISAELPPNRHRSSSVPPPAATPTPRPPRPVSLLRVSTHSPELACMPAFAAVGYPPLRPNATREEIRKVLAHEMAGLVA